MFLENVKQFVLMVWVLHINEIDQNDSGKIPQAKLSGNFPCCFKIDLSIGFFGLFLAGVFPTVDVYGDESFCLLNDKEAAAFEPDLFMLDFFYGTFQIIELI